MKRVVTLAVTCLLVLALIPTAAMARSDQPDWFVDESTLPFDALPGDTTSEQYWGIHTGAGYQIEVPEHWNGTLIMWAHGYRGEGARLFFNRFEVTPGVFIPVDFPPAVRAWMLQQGYAWAQSTYSENSYNVEVGVKDTHALARRFNGIVGKPDRVFIAGYSMGGHVAAVSGEHHASTYSGAMPMCGVVGDYELFDYFLDFNLAAQQLGLGISSFPTGPEYLAPGGPAEEIIANLGLDGFGPLTLTADGEKLKQLTELRSGGDRPNYDLAWEYWTSSPFLFTLGVSDGTVGGRPGIVVDNTDAVYQFDLDPSLSAEEMAFNDAITRVAFDRQARAGRGIANIPSIEGDLKIPTLTLHNLGDLFVPFHNEIVYAERVAAHGAEDLLVQRAIRGVDHCQFTDTEVITGLSELIAWSESIEAGAPVKPAGDVVLDPAVVASADYGCAFTVGPGTLRAPCP